MGCLVNVLSEQDTQIQNKDHGHRKPDPLKAYERVKSSYRSQVCRFSCHCPRPDGELQRSYQFSRR